ncbi:MAG: hypothetical protein GY756_25465, partial [bacterium]|nr:hypothetical protein [bacterium]
MKFRISAIIIFTLIVSNFSYAEESYKYGKQTLQITNELSKFNPRDENSVGEKELFNYLENYFTRLKCNYSIMDYSRLEKGHSFSQGYKVIIEGDIDDQLIIAVPLNSRTGKDVDNDGSINIAISLQLLEIFTSYAPPVTIVFLFLGAERGAESIYPIGSKLFLSTYVSTSPSLFLYLDMERAGDLITLKNSSKNDLTPKWFIENLSTKFIWKNLDFTTDSIQSLAFQSGFESPSSIIETYLNNDMPTLVLESRRLKNQTLNEDQWANLFIESLLSFILDNGKGFNKEWDRHYFITKLWNYLLVLGEKGGILSLIFFQSFMLLLILFRSRHIHLNLKRFKNHIWTFPLIFFLTFLYLFISTLIIEEISLIKEFPLLWQIYPAQFLIFKICTAVFLFSLFLYLVRGLSISRSHHFYTYSAFISTLLSMFLVFILNINFSYFFLWSLFLIIIFMKTKKVNIKRTAIILSPLPLVFICYKIFSHPYLQICNFLLVSRFTGNLFLTSIIMPTTMLMASLSHYHHRFHRHRRSFKNVFNILFWGSMTILVLYNISNSEPYNASNRQPVYVNEKIDLDNKSRSILLSSPAPIGDINLLLDSRELQLNNVKRTAEVTAPIIPDLLQITENYSTFLDRMSLNYQIDLKGSPETIEIIITSEKSLIIFDSNFPYEVTADGKEIYFSIGKNPKI